MTDSVDVSARLSTHEAVCAERYAGIMARLARLEKIALSVTGIWFMILLSVVGFFLARQVH